MKNKKFKKLWGIPLFIVIFALLVWVTMLLWNALLPAIFGIITITYWQALGLVILGRLLFGGFGKGGGGMRHFRHHHGHRGCRGSRGYSPFGRRGGDIRPDTEEIDDFIADDGDGCFNKRKGDPFRRMRDKMKSMTKDERREFFHNKLHNQHILWEEMLNDFDNFDKKSDRDDQQ